MKGFGSDNHAGVHPQLLKSLVDANIDHAPSYGTDTWSELACKEFNKLFAKEVKTFFVFNGTAANVLSLRAAVKPWQSVVCSDLAHLQGDECGAPEFFTGAKLVTVQTENGKIKLDTLKKTLIRRGDQHFSQVKVISLTQPTEYGTCYSLQEIKDICQWAHSENLYIHVDGARIANAVVSLNTSFKELLTDTGVDVVSFGGTKNGFMMGEAVVFLNTSLAQEFNYIRKQSAQLPSKTRFIAAQFLTYLQNNLWREIATHGLQMAQELYQLIKNIPDIEVTQPVQSNAVFVKMQQKWIKPLREKFFFYVWDELTFECRIMTSFNTAKEEIHAFAEAIKSLSTDKT